MYNAVLSNVTNCYFTSNFADDKAGGAYAATDCDAIFTNCVFDNNSADTDGGAFRTYKSSPTFINCTFTRNALTGGDGSAFDANNALSSPTFINCVFWGNTEADVVNEDLTLTTSATATITNCAFEGTYSATGATATGTVDISSADPMFVNTAGTSGYLGYDATADWAIQSGSPLINVALAAGAPDMDITRSFRDATPDIGAFENAAVVPYTIATVVDGPGTISPDGAYVAPGDDQLFVIAAEPGYEISEVTYDGTDVMASLIDNGDGTYNYTVPALAANGVISASFVIVVADYTVAVSSGADGSISPEGDLTVTVADETVFTITPDAGFVIYEFLLNDVSVIDDLVDNADGT